MQAQTVFRILVVDDEPPICDLLTRMAQKLFPEATFVNTRSAQETVHYLDNQPTKWPQLVLLDINLHQAVDGLTLLPQLHSRFKGRVPIIMLTTSADQTDYQKATDGGAVAFTQKPDCLQGWREYVTFLKTEWYGVA